jgi:hypothetical protein
MADLELQLEDLADEDMRAVVIRHEHPELEEAQWNHNGGLVARCLRETLTQTGR